MFKSKTMYAIDRNNKLLSISIFREYLIDWRLQVLVTTNWNNYNYSQLIIEWIPNQWSHSHTTIDACNALTLLAQLLLLLLLWHNINCVANCTKERENEPPIASTYCRLSCCLATCSLQQHAACNFAPPNGNCQAAKCLPSLLFALISADACAARPKYQSTRIVCPNYSGHSATHTHTLPLLLPRAHIEGKDKGSHPTKLGQNNNTTTRSGCCWFLSVGQGLTGLKLPDSQMEWGKIRAHK